VILDSNPDFRIKPDSDPDICSMLSIHYLVGVSHFAEWRENLPVSVREMIINLLKISYSAMVREIEK